MAFHKNMNLKSPDETVLDSQDQLRLHGKSLRRQLEFSVVETAHHEHKSVIKPQLIVPSSLLWHKPRNIISSGYSRDVKPRSHKIRLHYKLVRMSDGTELQFTQGQHGLIYIIKPRICIETAKYTLIYFKQILPLQLHSRLS